MRRPIKRRVNVYPDERYSSEDVSRLVNYVMLNGQKQTALKIVYAAFEAIKAGEGNPDPLEVFNQAIRNASPLMEVRSRRVGGANYQVPREVRPERRMQLALRWIIKAARAQAIRNASPLMEVRSRRVGGANYQVPREVRPERRMQLALRWIIKAARAHAGQPMFKSLAQELLAASKEEGSADRKSTR